MKQLEFKLSPENENKASLNELKFILEHSEKQLKESIDSADSVLNRSTVLLSVLMGVIISTTGLLIDKLTLSPFSVSIFLTLLYSAFLLYNLRVNILGHDYRTTGREPCYLLHDYYFATYPSDEIREKKILLESIDVYQLSITNNNTINKKRWDVFTKTLYRSLYIPIVFLAPYIAMLLTCSALGLGASA